MNLKIAYKFALYITTVPNFCNLLIVDDTSYLPKILRTYYKLSYTALIRAWLMRSYCKLKLYKVQPHKKKGDD